MAKPKPEEEEEEEEEDEVKEDKKPAKKEAPAPPAAPAAEPPVCEPAPLGLLGLAVAALVLMSADLGVTAAKPALMLPWTLFLGATAQLIAGFMDFQRKNIFGATVFTGFALLWYGITLTWAIELWGGVAMDPKHLTMGFLGYLVFGLYCTVAAMGTNKVLFIIMVFIDIAVALLVGRAYYPETIEANIIGVTLFFVVAFCFYASFAVLINQMAKKTVFPMGAPLIKFG